MMSSFFLCSDGLALRFALRYALRVALRMFFVQFVAVFLVSVQKFCSRHLQTTEPGPSLILVNMNTVVVSHHDQRAFGRQCAPNRPVG